MERFILHDFDCTDSLPKRTFVTLHNLLLFVDANKVTGYANIWELGQDKPQVINFRRGKRKLVSGRWGKCV